MGAEKINILVWQWGRHGAGPRFAYEMACELRKSNNCNVALSLSQQSEIYENLEDKSQVDFPVATYKDMADFIKKTASLPILLKQLNEFIETFQPDVVINAMPGIWDSFVTRFLKKRGISVVTIVHDMKSHKGDSFGFLYWLQKSQIQNSDGIVTLSDFVLEQLKTTGLADGKSTRKIPHMVFAFPDLSLPQPKTLTFSKKRPLRLLLIGRLSEYKGIGLFCDTLERIDPNILEARIVGSGNSPDIERARDLPNIELHHQWCTEADLISHIDWCDVVIAPYIEATQSGILPLAFSRGRPVIATPVGGLSEQVTHQITGRVSQHVSANSLTKEIHHFIDSPKDLHDCGLAARKHAENVLDWQSIIPQFMDVARSVHTKRGSAEQAAFALSQDSRSLEPLGSHSA